jgi:uncharacterized protein (DUF2132 family)
MTYDPQSHPLHAMGLEAVLSEVVRHYGWPILAEQIPINCFKSYPTFASAAKFLKKTVWARERLEAFYLYKFKQCARPSDEEHRLQPRNRQIDRAFAAPTPAEIELGDPEFFDDPASGPVFPSRKEVHESRSTSRKSKAPSEEVSSEEVSSQEVTSEEVSSEEVSSEEVSSEEVSSEEVSSEEVSSEEVTSEEVSSEEVSSEEVSSQEVSSQEAPSEEAPSEKAASSKKPASSDPWAKWRE